MLDMLEVEKALTLKEDKGADHLKKYQGTKPKGQRPRVLTQANFLRELVINNQNANQFAIHTTEGCYHDKPTNQAGFNIDTNCSMPSGCTVGMNAQNSYMSGFASAGGGVYATQYDSSGIL